MSRRESVETVAVGCPLVVCTDGLVERRGESIDVGIARLVSTVGQARSAGPEQLADHLMEALLRGEAQQDDVALVVYCAPS